MTVNGDPAERLDYAFDIYDLDQNGYIGFYLKLVLVLQLVLPLAI